MKLLGNGWCLMTDDGGYLGSLVYRRGFVLKPAEMNAYDGSEAARVLPCWNSSRFGRHELLIEPDVHIALHQGDECTIGLIGTAVDPFSGVGSLSAIARSLAGLTAGPQVLDGIDRLTGRFVIIEHRNDCLRVYHDAAGMRSVFYATRDGESVIASHPQLVADVLGSKPDSRALTLHQKMRGLGLHSRMPGAKSPIQGVRFLTPNTSIDALTGDVRRYWPRKPRIESNDVAGAARQTCELVSEAIRLAGQAAPLGISLTAGIDSRTTLACARQSRASMIAFTHVDTQLTHNVHEMDVAVASDIAERIGMEHRVIEVGPAPTGCKEWRAFERDALHNLAMPIDDNLQTTWRYSSVWPEGRLHMPSSISAVSKRVYAKWTKQLLIVSPESLARVWSPRLADDDYVVSAFEEFIDLTAFDDVEGHGYDPLDCLHWEQKHGAWGLRSTIRSMVFEEFCPFNNRRVIELALSLPEEDRENKQLLYGMIDHAWPELMSFPVNPAAYSGLRTVAGTVRRAGASFGMSRHAYRASISARARLVATVQSARLRRTVSALLGGPKSPLRASAKRFADKVHRTGGRL